MAEKTAVIGRKVPDFTLPATGGKPWRLSAARGKALVVYFYPKDNTSGCTSEGVAFAGLHDAFRKARAARPFEVLAIVVLPDHLYCVWRLPDGDAGNANRWAQIKSTFSRALPISERRSPQRIARRERGIWQRRYWEHLIRDEADLRHHVDYVHINPVKHGHAARAADWPYSSFRRWVSAGSYPLDWAAAEPELVSVRGER